MWALFQKEIAGFFSSLTGYIVIIVFLLVNGLFIWVFPGNLNLLDSGFSSLNTLFTLAPWVFLFLVPAITMRTFAEEKKSGTMDLLLTRPLSNLQIILGKYFASVALIFLSLLPVLIYYISVIKLGDTAGNIDHGAFWGSFIGLILLAASYTSIGIFSSTITDNIIVSFLIAVFISFLAYTGFNYIADLFPIGGLGNLFQNLGIDAHYQSMSRGVIDSRDVLYYLSIIGVFIVSTTLILKNKAWSKSFLNTIIIFSIIILINVVGKTLFFRMDLTKEKRYTLALETKTILEDLNEPVFIRIYLDGELNIQLANFQKSIKELLDEFRLYAGQNLQYELSDPFAETNNTNRTKILEELYYKGLRPVNIHHRKKDGTVIEKIIIPGASVNFNEVEIPLNLLLNDPSISSEENLNNSIEALEYTFISTIKGITNTRVEKVAFIEGHGEWPDPLVSDMMQELSKSFQVDRGRISATPGILDSYACVIIAGPVSRFEEADKYVLDQYIMQGGKLMWLLDAVNVNFDSLSSGMSLALPNDLNLEDMLFRYGARINSSIIRDIQCNAIRVNVALAGNEPKFELAPWVYYPILTPNSNHEATKNLNPVLARFASSIDTIAARNTIKKTPLLLSSKASGTLQIPAIIELKEVNETPKEEDYNQINQIAGVLLEGKFESVFKNRMINAYFESTPKNFIEKSKFTKMAIIADADIIRNDVVNTEQGTSILPLGFDRATNQSFGNKDFLMNLVNYLTDDSNLLRLRGREFKLRLLNKSKVNNERLKWQLINLILPVLIVILFGVAYNAIRKYYYTR